MKRISKYLAENGYCSRREADLWIQRGWVWVAGRPAVLGQKLHDPKEIEIRPEAFQSQAQNSSIMLNKPRGYVSGQPEGQRLPAVKLIAATNYRGPGQAPELKYDLKNLAPVGRLDMDSTGLLLLSQDGRLARELLSEHTLWKVYQVSVNKALTSEDIDLLTFGLELDGKKLLRARVTLLNAFEFEIRLQEGRYRQIRRMCELLGLAVQTLHRSQIGALTLGDLRPGEWRLIDRDEIFGPPLLQDNQSG